MSYIGSTPTTQSFIAGTDSFNGTGSATNFTLSRFVNSTNDIQVVVNNVVQYPPNYSVSGNTLTISPAPSAGTNNVYARYLSTTIQTFAPSQGTVGLTQLSATGTPSASTFLRGDNTWADSGAVGVGQTWTNVTSSRALSTTYTNSTGRPIQLYIVCTGGNSNGATVTIAGVTPAQLYTNVAGGRVAFFVIIPSGVTYLLGDSGATIHSWWELR